MLAIALPPGGDQFGNPVLLASNGIIEENILTIVLDDTSTAGSVTATITATSQSTGTVTAVYSNFASISFTGNADADGSIVNNVNLQTPYQVALVGLGATGTGTPLSPTNWQVDAFFTASPGATPNAILDLFNADSLNVNAATFNSNGASTIAGDFQSPTDLTVLGATGAFISLTDRRLGITNNSANVAIQTYDLFLESTNGPLAIDANVSTVSDLEVRGNLARLSLGAPSGGSLRSFSSTAGDIRVTSAAGPVVIDGVAFTAFTGGISVITPSTLTVTLTAGGFGSFTAPSTWSSASMPNGLVNLEGGLALRLPAGLPITAGRLELTTSGAATITLTNLSVDYFAATTNGNLEILNGVPLVISDDTNAPTVEISARDVTITSPAGIRVVDGIKASGNIVLSTFVAGATTTPIVPVDFVVTGIGDNPLATGPFAGTLRDMVEYVNLNRILSAAASAGITKQPMQLLFDEASSLVALGGEVTLAATLPALAKPITLDGSLPEVPDGLGGIVGINGAGVAGTGIVLGGGSAGSTIRDAAFYGFSGAGVRIESADNLVSGLTLGKNLAGNAIGIELSGPQATRNVIGVKTIGIDTGNTIVGNTQAGVLIRGSGKSNAIYGNTIGTTADGDGNGEGIWVVGSTGTLIGASQAPLANVISGNTSSGIRLTNVNAVSVPYGAQIVNNEIANNGAAGVAIEGGSRNLVGGTGFSAGNRLLGNSIAVHLRSQGSGRTQGNQILNNTITDSTTGGVLIDQGFGNLVQGNAISDDPDEVTSLYGVRIFRGPRGQGFSPNQVFQNTISGSGNSALNGGIVIENSSGQVIGGPGTLANIVVENGGSGIIVVGGTAANAAIGNLVEGNFVGTDATGDIRGNAYDGIRLQGSVGNAVRANTVKNHATGANNAAGIAVYDAVASGAATGNTVVRNTVADNFVGIRVSGGSNNAIGGRVSGLGNWVFNNASDGILVNRSAATGDPTATVVVGNRVGLATGPGAAGNGGYGINLVSTVGTRVEQGNVVAYNELGGIRMEGGRNVVIGSVMAGLGNVVRDNEGDGISIVQPDAPGRTEAVLVAGNTIRGNVGNGISVADTAGGSANTARVSGITIGRGVSTNRPDASTNTIVANGAAGVSVDLAQAVSIIGNAITGNLGAKQIELLNFANAILSPAPATSVVAPTLTAAAARVPGQASPQVDVRGTVSRTGTSTAAQTVWVDIYGTNTATNQQFFLGRVVVKIAAGAQAAGFRVMVTRAGLRFNQVVATATVGTGTSEFSDAIGI